MYVISQMHFFGMSNLILFTLNCSQLKFCFETIATSSFIVRIGLLNKGSTSYYQLCIFTSFTLYVCGPAESMHRYKHVFITPHVRIGGSGWGGEIWKWPDLKSGLKLLDRNYTETRVQIPVKSQIQKYNIPNNMPIVITKILPIFT